MLGRLLQTAAAPFQGATSRSTQTPLESIQEESHTRELLFPDPVALKTAQQFGASVPSTRPLPTPKEAASYDNKGGLDAITQDDIRIIIAQDTCGRWQSPQILFDSRKDDTKSSSGTDVDPMKKQALSVQGKAMTSPPQTSRRGHTPNSSIFSRPTPASPSTPKSPEARGLFGPSRLHRLPFADALVDPESRDEKDEIDTLLNCMFGAAGFRLHAGTKLHVMPRKTPRVWNQATRPTSSGGGPRKRTPLSRSTSMIDGEDDGSTNPDKRNASSKPSIMITRLFNVSLSDQGGACTHQRPTLSMDQKRSEEEDNANGNNVKQKRVPMYAVSIIIQLPDEGGLKSRPFDHGSFTPTASPRRDETGFGPIESRATPVFDSILRNNAKYVLGHWTILNRNIEILEHTASHVLRHILQAVPDAPQLSEPPAKGLVKNRASKKQTQQLVYVPPECLQDDKSVKNEVDDAAKLVVAALRIRKVVVGQERWGAWREEARWVRRWAAGKEQHAFFYHVLTAFLGNHNVWLRSLHSSHHRLQTPSHRQIFHSEHVNIKHRTVVVANDKMAARRLIFLLSHFFPSSTSHAALQASFLLGQSFPENPPSFSLGRERSLRRVINNKPKNSVYSHAGHNRSVSFSVIEQDSDIMHHPTSSPMERRGSEALSIRTTSLTIPTKSPKLFKSPTSTVLADADNPVPHFSAPEDIPGTPHSPRPSSGGSIASSALSQNLKRVDTSGTSNGGRWGSMVSAFWSNRRDSSLSDRATSIQTSPYRSSSFGEPLQTSSRLNEMVQEAELVKETANPNISPTKLRKSSFAIVDSPPKKLLPRETPEKRISETMRMPLSISFNEDDGFLDISFSPGHSFQSSLASSFGSFRLGTGSPCEQHSMMSSMASDVPRHGNDFVIDAAGWLKNYHPNFTLQAVRPYDGLIEEIKKSMFAEASITPTPVEVDLRSGVWVDICVTLVVDTATFGVQKLRLCRRKKPGQQPDFSYEEKLFIEPSTDIDNVLIDAVERVMTVSGHPSRAHSRSSSPKTPNASYSHANSFSTSRPTSIRGRNATNYPDGRPMAADAPHNETKRAVLGALEEVVKSVVEEVELSGSRPDIKHAKQEENSLRIGVKKWLNGIAEF